MQTDLVTDQARVRAILADPAYQVPPAPTVPAEQAGTLAWLRAHVARFCDGAVHDRRRGIAESELAKLDQAALRASAAERTADALASAGREPFDVMTIARRVPVAVLAAHLGLADRQTITRAVDAVLASAPGYPNPDAAGPGADEAVRFLAEAFGPADAELAANRIGLLEQACDATAGLIGNALIAAFADQGTADEIIAATLADDPPVRRTRRLTPEGAAVTLDISTCTFGAGRRPCPGADQAIALAAGVLDALLPACELADQQISYVPSPNLRMPARLLISVSG